MFTLTLHDRKGTELKEGDLLMISDGYKITFYAEVKYDADKEIIYPFHSFSFHSFERVDKLPDNAIECTDEYNRIWFVPNEEHPDIDAEFFKEYHSSWRDCEVALKNRAYRIKRAAIHSAASDGPTVENKKEK